MDLLNIIKGKEKETETPESVVPNKGKAKAETKRYGAYRVLAGSTFQGSKKDVEAWVSERQDEYIMKEV